MTEQDEIDARIQTYYDQVFDESARLTSRSAQGPLEFTRTQEIIREHVPVGRVLDIGGGAGVHARALQDAGYEVELIDPVPRHVAQARAEGIRAQRGDARHLAFPDACFDAALMLGPLYHLASRDDRSLALNEARRVVRPGGFVLATALSRYIAFGAVSLAREVPVPMPAEWASLIESGTPGSGLRFPAGHFHTAEELHTELAEAGLEVLDVQGVEGPGGMLLEVGGHFDSVVQDAALVLARAAASVTGVRDQSAHLIAVARRTP